MTKVVRRGSGTRKRLARSGYSRSAASTTWSRTSCSGLKGQCGAQFTQKMEGMCNDLQTARQKQQEYAGWREGKVRRRLSSTSCRRSGPYSGCLPRSIQISFVLRTDMVAVQLDMVEDCLVACIGCRLLPRSA